jgi:hypothetical protein
MIQLKGSPDRQRLELVFKEFKDLPFPPTGQSKEIQDVHGLLILYDADVAAAVYKLLDASIPMPDYSRLTGLQEDQALEKMINNLVRKYSADHEIGGLAREYANYYDMIKKVLHSARAYLNQVVLDAISKPAAFCP